MHIERKRAIWVAAATCLALTACSLFLPQPAATPSPSAGAGPATWALPPGQLIDAETTAFTALVTERECASGLADAGRVIGPSIAYFDDAVVVTFQVRGRGGAQGCPSNPAVPVEVHLDEPLGDRQLLDGGLGNPVQPPICEDPPFCA